MKFFYSALISIFLINCSTAPTVETNSKSNALTNSVNQNVAAIEQTNTNTEINAESNTQPVNVKIRSGGVINQENFEALQKPKKSGANAAPIEAVPMTNIAPDNSEISSTMNNQGVPIETRTFKNNPLLAKTEKNFANPRNPTMKVYLKNGKVVSFPASKISNSATASANEILIAAGAIPKTAPSENASKKAAN